MSRHFPKMEFPIPRGFERYQQTLQLMAVAKRMSEYGIRVDLGRTREHLVNAQKRSRNFTDIFCHLSKLDVKALGESGSGTTQAIKDYFWKTLEAPIVARERRSKKPQLNVDALIIYANDFADNELLSKSAAALYGIRKAKIAERFANAYLSVAEHEGGRIRFGFNAIGTKGERWSSASRFRWKDENGEIREYKLNAQQIPTKEPTFEFAKGVKTKLCYSMRDCFIPDEGCVILKADYDQLELRLIAYTSGASNLIEWIEGGKDTHMENARCMFLEGKILPHEGKTENPQTDREKAVNKYREASKPCAYGIAYQMPSGRNNDKYTKLHKQLKQVFPELPESYTNILVKRFLDLHPAIREWQDSTARSLKDANRVEIKMNGAFLYLPDTMRGCNQALNFPMQSQGGALINRAILNLDTHMSWKAADSAILAMVHDEVAVQCRRDEMSKYKDLIEKYMGAPAQIGEYFVGIPAKAKPGLYWGGSL